MCLLWWMFQHTLQHQNLSYVVCSHTASINIIAYLIAIREVWSRCKPLDAQGPNPTNIHTQNFNVENRGEEKNAAIFGFYLFIRLICALCILQLDVIKLCVLLTPSTKHREEEANCSALFFHCVVEIIILYYDHKHNKSSYYMCVRVYCTRKCCIFFVVRIHFFAGATTNYT